MTYKRVLLVEDDRLSRESLAYLLRGLGFEVRACVSAEEAGKVIKEFEPDVALLDVRLPGMQGDLFAMAVHEEWPATRIVFVSGEFRLDKPERFGGDVTFIPKPVDFGALLDVLQSN